MANPARATEATAARQTASVNAIGSGAQRAIRQARAVSLRNLGQHRLRLKLRLHSPHRLRNQNLSPFRRKRRHPKLLRLHPWRRRRGMTGEQKASVNAIENRAERATKQVRASVPTLWQHRLRP